MKFGIAILCCYAALFAAYIVASEIGSATGVSEWRRSSSQRAYGH